MRGSVTPAKRTREGVRVFLWDNPELRRAWREACQRERKECQVERAWRGKKS